MRYQILILVLSCFLPTLTYAQAIKVSGRLIDENQQAVEAAVVMFVRTPDNQMLEYSITDKQGNYVLQHDKKVAVRLVIKHLSYGTEIIALPEQCDTVLNLTLSSAPYEMEEVAVKGKRVPIQFKDGDWVMNVENFITPGTERAIDVVKKLPGMLVNEATKHIEWNGKNVELKLNGVAQPVTFELLKTLPPALLDQIILTPVKRADQDGSPDNAVIDIKTKKKHIDGFMGNMDGSYGIDFGNTLPGDTDGTFFVMLMKKNFYLNFLLQGYTYSEDQDISDSTWYGATQTSLASYQYNETKNEWGTSTNLNLSWDVKNGNRINANFYLSAEKSSPELVSTEFDSRQNSSWHNRINHETKLSPTGNIQYEASENFPFKLTASYGYIDYRNKDRYEYINRYRDTLSDDYTYFYKLTGRQHVIKVNANKRFFDKKLYIGVYGTSNFGKTTNDIRYEPSTAARPTDNFDYRENVSVGAFTSMYQLSKKMNLSVGLRAEYTNYILQLSTENLESSNHYWNYLPYAGLDLNFSENYTGAIHLVSNVMRPTYNALTPRVTYVSDKYYYTGNPWLKPAKIFTTEYFNVFFKRYSLSTRWEYSKDLYTSVLTDKGNQVTESSFKNCFDKWEVIVKWNAQFSFLDDRLNITTNLGWQWGKYRNFRDGFVVPKNRHTMLEAYLNFDYWLTKAYRLKLYGDVKVNGNIKTFQMEEKSNVHANLGLRYKCLAKKPLYLSLYATDIFNASRQRITSYYGDNIRYTQSNTSYQGITIGLSWNFQGGKDLKRQEVDGDVNAEDKRFED